MKSRGLDDQEKMRSKFFTSVQLLLQVFTFREIFKIEAIFFYLEPNSDTFDGNLGSRNTTKDTISLREACARAHMRMTGSAERPTEPSPTPRPRTRPKTPPKPEKMSACNHHCR